MKRCLGNFIHALLPLYIIPSSLIFVPYYNWRFAKENGFWQWLFFGEVVASVKAAAWPYYLFIGDPADTARRHRTQTREAFANAMTLRNQAITIFAASSKNAAAEKAFVSSLRQSLAEAERCDVAVLNHIDAGLGDDFFRLYVRGTRQFVDGVERTDLLAQLQGQTLTTQWGNRYERWRNQ